MQSDAFFTNYTGKRFIEEVSESLGTCKSFSFSVSFIKSAGLILIKDKIISALERGVQGYVITSTYQNFTDITSLRWFLEWQDKYPNFHCHLDFNSFDDNGFHSKGYIFEFDSDYEIIIGSSNITRFALLKNIEWDLAAHVYPQEPLLESVQIEFAELWKKTIKLDNELIERYRSQLEYAVVSWDMDYSDPSTDSVRPNLMQKQALREIARCRNEGLNKALIVAATASGKTFLAAFDARNFAAKRVLFVVHRDEILEKSLESFAKVFKSTRTYGLFIGETREADRDFVFASVQSLVLHLDEFKQDEFDYIVIDEVHHAAADTYRKIIAYFKPSFLLGLTATPDRMDGQSIIEMFGKNVPYNLTLREAMVDDLIVPFKYYGVKDSLIDYADSETSAGIRRIIQQLESQEHCEFVRDQIETRRPVGVKLRCVGFCRTVEHAEEMARKMFELGYHTAALSGKNSTGERDEVFRRLQDDKDPLNLVFAVDILNEGIDIPSINMVLFLRPTDSSTIFIQQLGRGLRKYNGKTFLTVVDFIANSYKRSVQIALALGSLTPGASTDKRTIADNVRSGFASINIPNLEINIEEKAQEEILKSIETTNFRSFAILKQDYQSYKSFLKLKSGEYPMHTDFLNDEVPVDLLHFTNSSFHCYYEFLERAGEQLPPFNDVQRNVINTLFWFLPLFRPYEYEIVRSLFDTGSQTESQLRITCQSFGEYTEESFLHSLLVLQDLACPTSGSSAFHVQLVIKNGDNYRLNFASDSDPFKNWLASLLSYGLERYQRDFSLKNGLLKLYSPYTGPKSFIALNEPSAMYMSGVHYLHNGLCLYINLNKDFQVQERLKYKDKFVTNKLLQWESQTETTLINARGIRLLKAKTAMIFVRKVKKEDGVEVPFVYLGLGELTNPRQTDNASRTLLFDIVLHDEVPSEYKYDFGISDTEKND